MGTFLTEDFVGANGTELKLHTGPLGACWNQPNASTSALGTGSAVIASNRLRGNSTNSVVYLASAVAGSDRAMAFTAVFRFLTLAGNSPWVGLRLDVKGTNGYRFGYDVSDGHWKFQYNIAGGGWTTSQIDFAQTLSAGVDYTMVVTIDAQGSLIDNIVLTIDGGSDHTAIASITSNPGCPAVFFDAAVTASTNTTGIHIDSLSFTHAAASPSFTTDEAFVYIGDSLGTDSDDIGIETFAQFLSASGNLNTDRYWNCAWAVQTVVEQNSLYTAQVAPLYTLTAGFGKRSAYIFSGNNDIGGGASAATLLANLQTLHASARATGWLSVACTIPFNATFTAPMNIVRATLNASIRSGWASWADRLSDLDLNGAFLNPYNPTYYIQKTPPVHWTAGGHSAGATQGAQDIRRVSLVGSGGRLVSTYPA